MQIPIDRSCVLLDLGSDPQVKVMEIGSTALLLIKCFSFVSGNIDP